MMPPTLARRARGGNALAITVLQHGSALLGLGATTLATPHTASVAMIPGRGPGLGINRCIDLARAFNTVFLKATLGGTKTARGGSLQGTKKGLCHPGADCATARGS